MYDDVAGPVASVEVMKDRVTGDPRGFAFVVFQDASTVDLVVADAVHEINHKVVDVKRAQARGVAPPSIHGGGPIQPAQSAERQSSSGGGEAELTPEQQQLKVFVGGIPPSVDNEELKHIFGQFGPVADSIVMIDQASGRSRGFGFVTFEQGSDGAHKAVEVQPIDIHGRRVEVKLAMPKGEQRRTIPAAGPKHIGLRAGISTGSGEYAGLAVAYGRSGWKAGYGTKAFGAAGWAVDGWEDLGTAPEKSGFSFSLLEGASSMKDDNNMPKTKRARR
jgi:RNA-binding protein Musashi